VPEPVVPGILVHLILGLEFKLHVATADCASDVQPLVPDKRSYFCLAVSVTVLPGASKPGVAMSSQPSRVPRGQFSPTRCISRKDTAPLCGTPGRYNSNAVATPQRYGRWGELACKNFLICKLRRFSRALKMRSEVSDLSHPVSWLSH